jgi:transposase-like protein
MLDINVNGNTDSAASKETIIKCRYCGCTECVKHGKMNNKTRYLCKNCGRNFTLNDGRIKHDVKEIELALLLYNNNVSLRGIQNILSMYFTKKIPFSVIKKWINNIAGRLDYYRINIEKNENKKEKEKKPITQERQRIDILEMDELWSYYLEGKDRLKKNSKYGLLLIGTEIKLLHLN